ncbi:hypothetical protein D3C80_1005170 [compost metagenome]
MTLQRRIAAPAPMNSMVQGPMPARRRHGSIHHMKPISTTTEKAHNRPVTLSAMPWARQAMAEKA